MKHLIRILTALLAIIMLLPAAVSCANTNDPEQTTDNATTTAPAGQDGPAPTEAPEETLFAISEIPADLKFDGEVIKFLYWNDRENPEFFVEDTNGESVNDAIYKRNERVQEQFAITLEFTGTPGNYNNQKAFINTCTNSTQSGTDAHDFFCGYSMTGATLMTQGLAQDLTQYEIMEFDKPWWPSTLIEKATIKDGIYFVSGDISTNYLYMMYGCVFNKDMFTDVTTLEFNTLYDLAYENKWTLDKLIEYSTGGFLEQNGDGVASQGDRFGFVTNNIHFDSFYTAADLSTVVTDSQGNIVLSEDLSSDKTADLLAKLCGFIHGSGDVWIKSSADIFANNQAIFTIDRVQITNKKLKDVDFNYGILPVPMYNEDQEGYRTCMAFPFTTYVLSTASTHSEAAAATLELMAYQSYLNITPALFEESMKLRYSDQSDDSFMFDKIRESVVIDLGRLLTTQVNNLSYSIFRSAVNDNSVDAWGSLLKANLRLFNSRVESVAKAIDNLG